MTRPRSPVRPISVTTTVPEDLLTRLQLHLFSDLEGRVPYGAMTKFFAARIREYLDGGRLDLAPYITGLPPDTHVLSGSRESVEMLRKKLETFL